MMERPQSTAPDSDLLATYRSDPEGSAGRSAISELFERYRLKLYHWCFRYAGSHEGALDLAQETLMEAFRALPRFEGRAKFSSWLYAIARHRCISAMRAPKFLVDLEVDPETVPSTSPDPEIEALTDMADERALALLREALDPLEQQAVWLRCFEGLSVPEVTRVLRLTDRSGARGLLQRARRKLRAAMAAPSSPGLEKGRS